MARYPSFSIVVEWENARLSGAERAGRALRELISQVRELSADLVRPPQLIVLHEQQIIPRHVVERAVSKACGSDPPCEVRIHATEGSDYYSQKNEGAQLASRSYVLFLDSDVIPEPGWLRSLVGSLKPGIDVVGGDTYVEIQSFFGRAFGLFWFFPVRAPSMGLREVRYFYANNVIFRRDLFLAYRFEALPLYRGQCKLLADRMRRNGVRLFQQTDARVSHPPPSPRHFVHRALSEGYDLVMRARLAGRTAEAARGDLRHQLANLQLRVESRLPHLTVGRAEIVAAKALGRAYYLLRYAGQRWAMRSPEGAQRALGIRSLPMPVPVDRQMRRKAAR
jgi:glycosyltransferase involved in cell wall biosynthesis